jgi:hypothetical protein
MTMVSPRTTHGYPCYRGFPHLNLSDELLHIGGVAVPQATPFFFANHTSPTSCPTPVVLFLPTSVTHSSHFISSDPLAVCYLPLLPTSQFLGHRQYSSYFTLHHYHE